MGFQKFSFAQNEKKNNNIYPTIHSRIMHFNRTNPTKKKMDYLSIDDEAFPKRI